MSGFVRKTVGAFCKQSIPFVTLALLMAPPEASAELVLQLPDVWSTTPVPDVSRQKVRRPMEFCLNGKGDLVIQHRDVSLTMAYAATEEIIEPQERLRAALRQDCPAISGISLTLSLQF